MSTAPRKFVEKNGVLSLNPEYLAWKQKNGITGVPTQRQTQQPLEAPIEKMTLQIQVLQGSGLVAKDRNFMGKKTTSDPYVVVSLISSRRGRKIQLGKTHTVPKNLSPKWDHTITTSVSFMEHGPAVGQGAYHKGPQNSLLVFEVYDEDKLSEDDLMGVVKLPLVWEDARPADGTWFEIPKDSAKNASGKLQIKLSSKVHRLNLKPYC